GPNTEEGKQRSRCNAVRHGLTAETVIGALEDAEDYQAFEAVITADYDAQTAVERELVLRLASLLWRIRRATAIVQRRIIVRSVRSAPARTRRECGRPTCTQLPFDFGPRVGRLMVLLAGFGIGHEQTIRRHCEAKAQAEPVDVSLANSCHHSCFST